MNEHIPSKVLKLPVDLDILALLISKWPLARTALGNIWLFGERTYSYMNKDAPRDVSYFFFQIHTSSPQMAACVYRKKVKWLLIKSLPLTRRSTGYLHIGRQLKKQNRTKKYVKFVFYLAVYSWYFQHTNKGTLGAYDQDSLSGYPFLATETNIEQHIYWAQ